MSSSSETPDPDIPEENAEALYWAHLFRRHGMLYAQALTLAHTPGVDRHAVKETLERGCDPELAFLIYS